MKLVQSVCVLEQLAKGPCDLMLEGGALDVAPPCGVGDLKVHHRLWSFAFEGGGVLQFVVHFDGQERNLDQTVEDGLHALVARGDIFQTVLAEQFVHVFGGERLEGVAPSRGVHVGAVLLQYMYVVESHSFADGCARP